MKTINVCRACLATDILLYSLSNSKLEEFYHQLTNISIQQSDGRPKQFCYECLQRLKQSKRFSDKCIRAEQALDQIFSSCEAAVLQILPNIRTDYKLLSQLSIFNYGLTTSISSSDSDVPVKNELEMTCENNVGSKLKVEYDKDGSTDHFRSENEEDVPLSKIKSINNSLKANNLKLEVNYNNDGAGISTDHIKSEVVDIDIPLSVSSLRNNVLTESVLKLGVDYNNDSARMSTDHIKSENIEDNISLGVSSSRNDVLIESELKLEVDYYNDDDAAMSVDHIKSGDEADDFVDDISIADEEGIDEVSPTTKSKHMEPSLVNLLDADIRRPTNIETNKLSVETENTEAVQKPTVNLRYEEINKTTNASELKPTETTDKNLIYTKLIHRCDICNRPYLYKASLVRHMNSHKKNSDKLKKDTSRVKEGQLKIVEKEVSNSAQQSNDNLLSCESCNYKTAYKNNLIEHTRIHTGEKPLSCELCNFKTRYRSNLNEHTKIHSGDKPFTCDFCSYKTERKNSLIKHRRIHTGEKPFTCEFCSYKTVSQSTLIVHTRRHTGEKPYACNVCPYKATNTTDLLRHTRRRHGEKNDSEETL